ncbi:hypothetical protein [uncultured Sneathiella sp.]|jgi:hypothetical protein|uniref:hypothetical protein n=1 Tax=uncultured Sneathiella sp. TaxID=879315 RepID=UPI0030DD8F7D|tara:strand:- start:530 stop:1405 length:876 start_codon:yes stop_codon:yes gene_type:complete
MQENYWDYVQSILCLIWNFLNSNFITALAGAFFGAIAAYYIAKKHQQAVNLREEIRNINAAITLTFSVFISSLSLKEQQIKPMMDGYKETSKQYEEYMMKLSNGQKVSFAGTADMSEVAMPLFPTETISEIIYGKIAAPTRVAAMYSALNHATNSIKELFERRHQIIYEWKSNKNITEKEKLEVYLGLVQENRTVDERYSNIMDEISKSLDDCIFYSFTIAKDLNEYGCKLAEMYGKNTSIVVGVKLPDELVDKDLMPDEDNYRGWFDGFKNNENSTQNKSIWDRLKFWSS